MKSIVFQSSTYSLFFMTCFLAVLSFACKKQEKKEAVLNDDLHEAREDSIELVAAYAMQSKISLSVTPDAETRPIRTGSVDDDAADDMAVWVNKKDPGKSVIIGTNKKGGIAAYTLTGEEVVNYTTGRINNIDVMHDLPTSSGAMDIMGCTNRTDQSIDLYRIHQDSFALTDVAAHALAIDTQKVKDIYGLCFYNGAKPYLFINGKNGAVQQFEIIVTLDQKVDVKLVRDIAFGSQTEGMVVDEQRHVLYVGEEDKGIWRLSAKADGGDTKTLIPMSNEENPNIAFDIEGLAIYKDGTGGFLLASSQGNFSYAVFDRGNSNEYITSFKIIGDQNLDGVEETDGIEAISLPLGSLFPKGVFIAQDGFNHDGDTLRTQNFKIVSWNKIAASVLNPAGNK
jgi:3-phytase